MKGEPRPFDGECYRLYQEGLAQLKAGQSRVAAEAFRRSSVLKGYSWTRLRQGEALLAEGEQLKAKLCFEAALQEEPGLYRAQCLLAKALMNLGRFDEANRVLHKAIQYHPDSAQARQLRRQLDSVKF